MNLYALTQARAAALEERGKRKRSSKYVHIYDLAVCGWLAWFNRKYGAQPKPMDLKSAAKTAGGERLEPFILGDFLNYSDAQFPGGLQVARKGRERIALIDSHYGIKSPTWVHDPKLKLGGRCDAVLADQKKVWRIWDAKTVGPGGEDVLFDLWNTEDIVDYLKHKPFALWWRWPDPWQMVGYMHCASITYKRKIREAIITYFCKDSLFAFDVLFSLDDPDLVDMQNRYLEQAKIIRDSLAMGEEVPPKHLYKVADPRWCEDCVWHDRCQPEYIEIAKAEDVTDRMPELEQPLQDFLEATGGKKTEEQAREKLKDRVRPLFDKVPEKEGDKFERLVRFKDVLVTATYSWQRDSTHDLTDTDRDQGFVITRKGGPRLNVTAKKIETKEE